MTDSPASDTNNQTPTVSELEVRGVVVGVFQENCWIIGNRRTHEAICVDPGGQSEDILHLADEMGMTIKLIACSHAHIDHVLGVRDIQAKTGAPFLLHPADLEILRGLPESAQRFGIDIDDTPTPDAHLDTLTKLDVDGLSLEVIHTPGHTQGSTCFYTNELLFSGDTLFQASIGRTDLPGGDHAQEMASIVDKLLPLPDETIVLPGHMDQTTIGHEREKNPFVRMELQARGRA
jgi:glyoxylase-like metal-dependent hydrolase (beta-lactamase superfamily II)